MPLYLSVGPIALLYGTSSGCRWRILFPDKEDCGRIEQSVIGSWQGVVLQVLIVKKKTLYEILNEIKECSGRNSLLWTWW
jgi:hypothetical protein